MSNYTPLNIKKKKGNFFLVANIFLMILVVGATGFYLRNRLITTEQKAIAPGACQCASDATGNNVGGCSCSGSNASCPAGSHVKNNRCGETSGGGGETQQSNEQSCNNSGGHWCDVWDVKQKKHSFCAPQSKSCNQQAVANGITMQTGGGGPGEGGWLCQIGKKGYTGGPCVEYNSISNLGNGAPPNCFCGIIQIDGGTYAGTYESTCSCQSEGVTPPPPTLPPGTTPTEVPTPTEAVTPTEAPTPTEAITPTEAPTGTPTPTPTPTGTLTPTPTGTLTPTVTPTPTEIVLASQTPTTVASIPQAGKTTPFLFAIPIAIIILGLLL